MANLSTTYMGLQLRNPIIAGASGLTSDMDTIKRLEDAGVGAIVTKSLFEEQIQLAGFKFEEDKEKFNYRHAEMVTVFPDIEFAGPDEHLMWVRRAKESVAVPVIASLNAVSQDTWLEYAKLLEETGVDGLECNVFAAPVGMDAVGADIEKGQVELISELKKTIKIPVSVKLSYFYTNPLNVISRMDRAGADAFVLFNRLFEPDLDIAEKDHSTPFNFSHETDYRLPLRYAGLLDGQIKADVCAGTGILGGESIIKMILTGAASVQTVTALYRKGVEHVGRMLKTLENWMDGNGFDAIDDFKGRLSKRNTSEPWAYTRTQYAKLLMNPQLIIKNAPVE